MQFRVPAGGDNDEVRDLLAAHQRYHGLRGEQSLLTLALPLPVALSMLALAWPDRCPAWLRQLAFGSTAALLLVIPVVVALEFGAYRRMVRSARALDRDWAEGGGPRADGQP